MYPSFYPCFPSVFPRVSLAKCPMFRRRRRRFREALLRNAAHEEAVGEDVFIALQRSSISDYY